MMTGFPMMMVSLQSSHRKMCPDIVFCSGFIAAGTRKTNFCLFRVSIHYRHCRINMIIQFR